MKQGFTIIEMLIVIVLASLLLTLIFGSFIQSNKLVRLSDDSINLSTSITIAHHQLDKDISGAWVPFQVYTDEDAQKKDEEQKEERITVTEPLTKIFYARLQDNQLELLTFISNNPLQAYWSERLGKPQPHLVRIVYRLVPDDQDTLEGPPSFKLLRQGDADLDFDAYSPDGTIREYELLNNIKSITVSFTALIETVEEEGTEKRTIKELKKFDTWDSDTKEVMSNNKRLYIPSAVTLTITVWDAQKQQEQEFVTTVLIPANSRSDYVPQTTLPAEELKKTKSMVRLPTLPTKPAGGPVQ